MTFDFTKPNSTPTLTGPVAVTGTEATGAAGTLSAAATAYQAPQISATLRGVESAGVLGTALALPNVIFLTGVQATGYLSDNTGTTVVTGPNVIRLTGTRAVGGTGYFGGVSSAGVPNQLPVSNLNIPLIMKSLQVPSGLYTGAYFSSQAQNGINWYAANIGLLSIVQFMSTTELETYIRPYLDAYVNHVSGDYSISDVSYLYGSADLNAVAAVPQAFDDAYVSTFVRLACRYSTASQNFAWFDTNRSVLGAMVDNMLFNNLRPDGLIASFSGTRRQSVDQALIKNNCENWAALNDLASLLISRNDLFNGQRYANLASSLATAIDTALWVPTGTLAPGFKNADTDLALASTFNPNVVSQAYPQAMGVAGLSGRFTQAYAYINNNASGWENGGYDTNLWLVIGLAAALRADSVRARTHLATFETRYAGTPNATVINELGMYQRINSVLAGLPSV